MIIPKFYKDSEIFVTGGSGVVGKALIEKLLRTCDVKRIYVLLRPKKDLKAEQRLDKIRAAKIFRRLRGEKPEVLNKITAVPGDAVLPNLGITPEYAKILENVSFIFNCAATVRFDEPLKVALRLNVAGTLEALKFAMTLKRLKVFMHVSTYFSNPYLTYVEPKLYSSPMDWRLCLELLEGDYDDDTLDFLTKKMITGFPNTYTFTKNLAESMVNEFRDRLPIAIFRPSIVLFALTDPEPGFPPSLMGAMGLFALVGAGILKTVYIKDDIRLDLTPQDMGITSMLYYGPKTVAAYANGTPAEVPVFLFSSAATNPFTFKYMSETVDRESYWAETAYEKNFLIPGAVYTSSRLRYKLIVFTKQILPALLVDFILVMTGRKPALMSIVRKAYITLKVMEPFMFNNIDSPGVTYLEEMENEFLDTEFDISDTLRLAGTREGLKAQIRKMCYKIREILLNEDPSTLPKARRVLKVKQFIYNVIRAVFYFFMLRLLYRSLMNYVSDFV